MKRVKKVSKRDLRVARAEAEAQNDPRFRDVGGYGLKSAAPTLTAKNDNQKQALFYLNSWHAHRPADRFCWYWQVDAGCLPGCNATEGEGC
jgi:hypothetical protein